jgi:hypothetical protein
MDSHEIDDDVVYLDVIANPAPQWLRLELPHCVPAFWLDPITDFVGVVVAILEPDPPEAAILQVLQLDQNLQFEVALDPRLDRHFDSLALQRAAKAFGCLSAQIALARRMPVSRNPNKNNQYDDQNLQAAEWAGAPMKTQRTSIGSWEDEMLLTPTKTKEVPIFEWKNSSKNGGRDIGRDADSARRMLATIQELKRTGHTRPLCPPPSDWKARVGDLLYSFPNFASVVKTMVRTHLVMMDKNEPHRLAPVLLVGQPGIGKTYFANALAQTLGLPNAMFISMAGETNGSALAGSSTFWANSSPGKLFETLAWGANQSTPPANPLVVLDEIDKISVGQYNPLGALYGLLEEDTAKVFQDQSLDISIDARHVRFVCTANDVSLIPEPLLTRMVVFHIDPPSTKQLRVVIQNIYEGLISRLQTPMSNSLSEEVVQAALMLNPRESKVRLECAIASAITEDRAYLKLSDWPDIPSATSQANRRSIGFTA